MKVYFSNLKNKLLHILIYVSCYLNLPYICAYVIFFSIFKPKLFQKDIKTKKTFIVLYREIGIRDIEIIYKSSNYNFEFMFLKRSIFKIILFYFSSRKKSFTNFFDHPITENTFFNQKTNDRKNHEKFLTNVLYYLKKYFIKKDITLITFNFTYSAEIALYAGCKNNNLSVILWHKEGVQTDIDSKYQLETRAIKFRQVFQYFSKISVYNELTKKNFIKIDKKISKKIFVNGCPRLKDYLLKKKYHKKPKNILLLSFDKKRGIPKYKQYDNFNWNNSYNQVIEILNDLSKNKSLNIMIKKKHNSKSNIQDQIDKRIKIFKSGSAEKYINQADVIIGHNSSSTIEALVNGKFVMVPFFEKNLKLRKFLLNFNSNIIYTSKKKMKKTILNYVNNKVHFPLSNKKHLNTIKYYLGDPDQIIKKYLKFLNN